MQPSHAISDLFFAPSRLGKERLAGAYAWQSLIKSGAIIAGGSDAPVERGEPMIEFYAAVARKSVKGDSRRRLASRAGRLARAGAEDVYRSGRPTPRSKRRTKARSKSGKLADLTVLSKDIMKIPEPEILTTTLRDDGDRRRDCFRREP